MKTRTHSSIAVSRLTSTVPQSAPDACDSSDSSPLRRDGDRACEVAGRSCGGDDDTLEQVYAAHYAKPFRDAEERDRVRESLASIGFGNAEVDQTLTDVAPEASL